MRSGRPLIAERVLLDTHALLWWLGGADRLSRAARRAVERVDQVLVSPISIWETGMLERKGRIRLDRDLLAWTRDLFDDERVTEAALSPQAAAAAALLPAEFPGDPADRLLYGTAMDLGVPFVTKDMRLGEQAVRAGDVRVVW